MFSIYYAFLFVFFVSFYWITFSLFSFITKEIYKLDIYIIHLSKYFWWKTLSEQHMPMAEESNSSEDLTVCSKWELQPLHSQTPDQLSRRKAFISINLTAISVTAIHHFSFIQCRCSPRTSRYVQMGFLLNYITSYISILFFPMHFCHSQQFLCCSSLSL